MESHKGVIGTISKRSHNEVEWTIQNFSSYTVEDEFYYSPLFSISSNQWCMRIYPNGQISCKTTGWISLFLYKISHDGRNDDEEDEEEEKEEKEETISTTGANFSFGVKKEDGKVEQIGSEFIWLFEDKKGYGRSNFLQKSELQKKKSELLPKDTLALICTLRTQKDIESYTRLNTLRDFADLYISKRGCDATLKVKEKEFSVHKLILSARSPVFASMFEIDMKEKRTGVVDIPDCDPEAFREFLLYLYSGKLEKVPCNAIELYKIANKYGVEDLKPHCLIYILSHLTIENFFDAVIFGRLFCLAGIKKRTQDFFNENFTKILKTNKWSKFMKEKPSAANELLQIKVEEMESKK